MNKINPIELHIGGELRRGHLTNDITDTMPIKERVPGTPEMAGEDNTEMERQAGRVLGQVATGLDIQVQDVDEWAIMKDMEDQGIVAWKNWCKFQDMSSTVDPRKVMLYIDGYVLPRENALLQKINNGSHCSLVKGELAASREAQSPDESILPVSMIEMLVRPVMRLWANQRKEKYHKERSRHSHYNTDTSPETIEHVRDLEQEPASDEAITNSGSNILNDNHQIEHPGRSVSPRRRCSTTPIKQRKPLVLAKTHSNLNNCSANNDNHIINPGERRSARKIDPRSNRNPPEEKPYIDLFIDGKLPRTPAFHELKLDAVVKYSLRPYASTLPALYRQWTEATEDRLSVVSMNGYLGVTWRLKEDSEYYEWGSKFMVEVVRLMGTYELSIPQVLEVMENERQRRESSVGSFIAALVRRDRLSLRKRKRSGEEIYSSLNQ